MAKNPEPDKTPQAERSIERGREEAQEPGPLASSEPQASKGAARPKSPREFIQERMRELDKKGP